jgi:hypothetical protein
MTAPDENHKNNIDALEAMAAGEQPAPETPAEADASPGPSSGLMLLSDGEREPAADEFLQSMSAEADTPDNEALGDLAAAAGTPDDAEIGEVAAASSAAMPTIQPQRATRLQANVRRSHSQAYKRMMIPLLIVVGMILIGISALTLVMLMGGASDDPDSIAAEGTGLAEYGKFFVLAALPLGAILLMGAWLFYLDLKRSEARSR